MPALLIILAVLIAATIVATVIKSKHDAIELDAESEQQVEVKSRVTELSRIDLASVIRNSKSLTQPVKSVIAKADRMLICNCKHPHIETNGAIHYPVDETALTGGMYVPFDLAYYLVNKAYKGRLRFLTKDDKTRFYDTIKDVAVYNTLKGDAKLCKLRSLKQVKIGLHVDKLPVSAFNVK